MNYIYMNLTAEEKLKLGKVLIPHPLKDNWFLDTDSLKNAIEPRQQPTQPRNVWLIDFRTLAHPISRELDKLSGTEEELFDCACLLWELRLTNIPTAVKKVLGAEVPMTPIVCDDGPVYSRDHGRTVYWRAKYDPSYKEGRAEKPKSWNVCTAAGYLIAGNLGLPVLSQPTFEGDDLIAWFVKHKEELAVSHRVQSIGILTCDTDLLQLVDKDGVPVYWYNTMDFDRYRDWDLTLAYWLRRHKTPITSPRDIVSFKAKNGDRSDNLKPGSNPGLIDLLNPLESLPEDYTWAVNHTLSHTLLTQRNNQCLVSCLLKGLSVQT